MNHTPGPWKVTEPDHRYDAWSVKQASEKSFSIAAIHSRHGGQDDEATANARLIAAAPKLLEQRNELLAALVEMALGHHLQICPWTKPYPSESMPPKCDCYVGQAKATIAKAKGE